MRHTARTSVQSKLNKLKKLRLARLAALRSGARIQQGSVISWNAYDPDANLEMTRDTLKRVYRRRQLSAAQVRA